MYTRPASTCTGSDTRASVHCAPRRACEGLQAPRHTRTRSHASRADADESGIGRTAHCASQTICPPVVVHARSEKRKASRAAPLCSRAPSASHTLLEALSRACCNIAFPSVRATVHRLLSSCTAWFKNATQRAYRTAMRCAYRSSSCGCERGEARCASIVASKAFAPPTAAP